MKIQFTKNKTARILFCLHVPALIFGIYHGSTQWVPLFGNITNGVETQVHLSLYTMLLYFTIQSNIAVAIYLFTYGTDFARKIRNMVFVMMLTTAVVYWGLLFPGQATTQTEKLKDTGFWISNICVHTLPIFYMGYIWNKDCKINLPEKYSTRFLYVYGIAYFTLIQVSNAFITPFIPYPFLSPYYFGMGGAILMFLGAVSLIAMLSHKIYRLSVKKHGDYAKTLKELAHDSIESIKHKIHGDSTDGK